MLILGSVYYKYFSKDNIIVENTKELTTEENQSSQEINKKKENEKEIISSKKTNIEKKEKKSKEVKEEKKSKEVKEEKQNKKIKKKVENLVKEVEYTTTDRNGNKYKILANSARTNVNNKNILDLDNVRGVVTSEIRAPIYIVSDFAEYNSSNLNSNFYQNVVINFEDQEITCDNFDIDMETNTAIAYNNVVVTDPKSKMTAGIITFDMKTKDINILPNDDINKVKVNTTTNGNN